MIIYVLNSMRLAMDILFKKLNPAVKKPILVLLSGIVWLGTGVMLISMAVGWFKNSVNQYAIWFALTGVLAGPYHADRPPTAHLH